METIEKIDCNTEMSDIEKARFETQIDAAKKYPRSIKRCKENALELITKEIAQSCRYSYPANGKVISGPSVHLARILAQSYGNIIVDSKVLKITSNQVIARGACIDLENNYSVTIQVIKSTLNKYGKPLNADEITMAANATNAICYRTAVFAVIPETITNFIYDATKNIITGDTSKESDLIKFRKEVIKRFEKYNASEQHILELLGIKEPKQIDQERLVILLGVLQALNDGDATPGDLFKPLTTKDKKVEMKKKGKNKKVEME